MYNLLGMVRPMIKESMWNYPCCYPRKPEKICLACKATIQLLGYTNCGLMLLYKKPWDYPTGFVIDNTTRLVKLSVSLYAVAYLTINKIIGLQNLFMLSFTGIQYFFQKQGFSMQIDLQSQPIAAVKKGDVVCFEPMQRSGQTQDKVKHILERPDHHQGPKQWPDIPLWGHNQNWVLCFDWHSNYAESVCVFFPRPTK